MCNFLVSQIFLCFFWIVEEFVMEICGEYIVIYVVHFGYPNLHFVSTKSSFWLRRIFDFIAVQRKRSKRKDALSVGISAAQNQAQNSVSLRSCISELLSFILTTGGLRLCRNVVFIELLVWETAGKITQQSQESTEWEGEYRMICVVHFLLVQKTNQKRPSLSRGIFANAKPEA